MQKKSPFYFFLAFTFLILGLTTSHGDEPPLINIQKLAPSILVELRYATTHNFTGKKLYAHTECVLAEPAAKRLAQVQSYLNKKKLGLKVWDCYRPVSVQKQLWKVVPDPRYVADPKKGSRHNRGASIDLTLVDQKGDELPMPTKFDSFEKRAHRNYTKLPKHILKNRKTLQDAMEKFGFISLPTEWWHFDDPEWKNYALRDEPIGSVSLKKDKPSHRAKFSLASHVNQVVVVKTNNWNSTTGTLERYERKNKGWKKLKNSWTVSIGSKGLAWGHGLHPGIHGPIKHEGDKKATAGVFPIGKAYGYQKSKPKGTSWPYQQVDHTWRCVDDPTSSKYNQVLSIKGVKKDWRSAEKMKRSDHLYSWVINIEQNQPDTLKGGGSCIFFHVWRGEKAVTRGCTAMEEENIVELLRWLKPNANPHFVQLPKAEYKKYKKKWKLP